jgi:plastocyanin
VAAALVVATLVAAGCGDDGGDEVEAGATVSLPGTVSDHGAADLGTATELALEVDDQYFAPTFITASPGTTVTVTLTNEGTLPHTFTIDELDIDVSLAAGEEKTVEVELPDQESAVFYCRFHRGAGMQGAFALAGSATAADDGAPTTTRPASGGGYGY